MAKEQQAVNLLEGKVFSSLLRLALPITASSLLQMAYNFIDMMWIGRLSYQAVAAVGITGLFLWFGEGVLMLARVGGQVYTGQALGRKDLREARAWVKASCQYTFLISALLCLFFFLFAPQLIGFFQISEVDTFQQGVTYLRLMAFGLFFSFPARTLTGLVTVNGQSKLSMRATIVGLLLNLVLDPLCIFVLGWGVAGAALATLFSQAVVLLCFVYFLRHNELFQKLPWLKLPSLDQGVQLFRLGLPPALQTMAYSSISMVIGRMVSSFGDAAISVQKVGAQIESISWMMAEGFGVALTALIAQNYGARQWNRTRESYQKAFLVMLILGLINTLLLCGLPGPIFQIFIPQPEILAGGISYLQILGLSQFFMCLEIMTSAAFAGLGKTTIPALVVGILTFLRIPLSYLLSSTSLGIDGIWWAISLTSILKGIVLTVLFWLYLSKCLKEN